MASSGIEVDSELKECYNLMRQRKLVPPMALLAMALSDDKKKVIKKDDLCMEVCSPEDLVKFFENRLDECLYAVFDYKQKLILIKWAPDTAPAAKKMVYASTFATMKTACDGAKKLEATDLDDLSVESLEKAKN